MKDLINYFDNSLCDQDNDLRDNLKIIDQTIALTDEQLYSLLKVDPIMLDIFPTNLKYCKDVVDYAYEMHGDRIKYSLEGYNDEYRKLIAYKMACSYEMMTTYPEAFDGEASKQYCLKKSV